LRRKLPVFRLSATVGRDLASWISGERRSADSLPMRAIRFAADRSPLSRAVTPTSTRCCQVGLKHSARATRSCFTLNLFRHLLRYSWRYTLKEHWLRWLQNP